MKPFNRNRWAAAAAAILTAVCLASCQTEETDIPAALNRERLRFLASYGWEADPAYGFERTVIPLEWGGVYRNYNEIQLEQGFDLFPHRGETVLRYTYPVRNHPSGREVLAHLFVKDGLLIGGDICCPALDGFLHGFEQNPEIRKE